VPAVPAVEPPVPPVPVADTQLVPMQVVPLGQTLPHAPQF
jgi:hypothetical protein